MRIPRIFLPDQLACGCQVNLTGESFHYVVRVLRLQPGAKLMLFNGHGGQFEAILTEIGLSTTLRILSLGTNKFHGSIPTELALLSDTLKIITSKFRAFLSSSPPLFGA